MHNEERSCFPPRAYSDSALRALSESVFAAGETAQDATVQVSFNGAQSKSISITGENSGVMHVVTFDGINPGTNCIAFKVDGTFA